MYQGSPEKKERIGDTQEIYFKELAHVILGAGKSEIYRADHRLKLR